MDFKNVDKKYRPVPFWSWNEKLDVKESLRQTAIMDEAGMGGFFMHARGGLQTEYMGEEWFENVGACIEEANKRGMHPWAYDENGWPSGFGGGKVTDKGEKYWQKSLNYIDATADRSHIPEHRILKVTDKYCFYYDVNRFYVDLLDREVVADFINEIYLPYYEKFGDSFEGFFTDEPQLFRYGLNWSNVYVDEYRKAYGENLIDVLPCLFFEEEGFEQVRVKFWKLTTELFSKNFMKQIYDWCEERNLKFTGHLLGEMPQSFQTCCNGAAMPQYEYFSIPGMDWLGRTIGNYSTPVQLASAAAQTGKKQIICETFGICGHNMTHDALKRIYEWVMVRGVNLLCQHLQGYSNRGLRKRDCPPALYIQQPWWPKYKIFNDAMSRIGMLLTEGKITINTLLMHNITSSWICFNNGNNTCNGKKTSYYDQALGQAAAILDKKHIPYHYGDEILMERHGRVEGNKLIIGEMSYDRVVIPEHIMFLPNTEKLLAQFRANGGIITTAEELEPNDIIDSEKISYTYREFDDFTMHYFVNSNNETIKAKITRGSYALDIITGDKVDFYGEYTFGPNESLVVIDDGTPHAEKKAEKELNALDLSGKWDVVNKTANAITLDKCTYWFDGELQEENGYVLNVAQRASALEREVDVRCAFNFTIDQIPEKLYLGCETPEIFEISLNGLPIEKTDYGYFRDKSIRLLDISNNLKLGENTVEIRTLFKQSEETYQHIRNSAYCETEINKLSFDMEIEPMYLVGDFEVKCDGNFEPIEATHSCFYDGTFAVTKSSNKLELSNIEQQGYPFFAGEMTFKKTFNLGSTNYKISFNKNAINAIELKVNGKFVKDILWAPYDVDLSDYLTVGENTVEIIIYNNIRNLFGPHHHINGELFTVSTRHFYKEPCAWTVYCPGGKPDPFTEKYSFVNTSLI